MRRIGRELRRFGFAALVAAFTVSAANAAAGEDAGPGRARSVPRPTASGRRPDGVRAGRGGYGGHSPGAGWYGWGGAYQGWYGPGAGWYGWGGAYQGWYGPGAGWYGWGGAYQGWYGPGAGWYGLSEWW
jgi:hypothetical protein